MDKKFISSPNHQHWPQDPSSLLLRGYWGLLAHGQYGWGIKLGTHFHPVTRFRISRVIFPLTHTSSWNAETTLLYLYSTVAYLNKAYFCLNSINITE
jgi:hypothetical protein